MLCAIVLELLVSYTWSVMSWCRDGKNTCKPCGTNFLVLSVFVLCVETTTVMLRAGDHCVLNKDLHAKRHMLQCPQQVVFGQSCCAAIDPRRPRHAGDRGQFIAILVPR